MAWSAGTVDSVFAQNPLALRCTRSGTKISYRKRDLQAGFQISFSIRNLRTGVYKSSSLKTELPVPALQATQIPYAPPPTYSLKAKLSQVTAPRQNPAAAHPARSSASVPVRCRSFPERCVRFPQCIHTALPW